MTELCESTLDAAQIRQWIERACVLLTDAEAELTALDAAIGDADHGANMRRGFDAAQAALADAPDDPAAILKAVAMSLISQVGGTSGPLYGTFFLRMATALNGVDRLDQPTLAAAMHRGVEGMMIRGHAQAGEKTMLDAWLPALAALDCGATLHDSIIRAAQAADEGCEATKAMRATKGRASYLGARSVGHIDPGAASTVLILRALADVVAADGSGEQS